MTAINTPIADTATNTQAEDTVQNPVTTVSTTTGAPGRHIAHIALVFNGINVDPNTIYDMVNSAYGTVASVKATVARNTYIFDIET